MTEPFLGQLLMASFDFPPKGYAACTGQTLPISQNQALYSLLGTLYGGDGKTTFALPDLRGRTPIHLGGGQIQGEKLGSATVTLNLQQLPSHTHPMQARNESGGTNAPHEAVFAATPNQLYHEATARTAMADSAVSSAGGTEAHPNMAPYAVINLVIAIQGIFPSRN